VPTKALAEEKYAQFTNLYFDLGIKTVISTRDHQQYDDDIRKLNFHIAVVVYEKMKNLLVLPTNSKKSP
jgi:replicative superfamily II helicase